MIILIAIVFGILFSILYLGIEQIIQNVKKKRRLDKELKEKGYTLLK